MAVTQQNIPTTETTRRRTNMASASQNLALKLHSLLQVGARRQKRKAIKVPQAKRLLPKKEAKVNRTRTGLTGASFPIHNPSRRKPSVLGLPSCSTAPQNTERIFLCSWFFVNRIRVPSCQKRWKCKPTHGTAKSGAWCGAEVAKSCNYQGKSSSSGHSLAPHIFRA